MVPCYQLPEFFLTFEMVGRNFCFSLLILIVIDMVTSPYQGLVHDSRLYALQASSHIYPSRFKEDLFLLFGSQDKFTIFSYILSPLIKILGLQPGMFLGYIASKILFLSGVLALNRQLIKNQGLALIASLLIASGPLLYIFFDINEPFLTPRLLSCAFCLLGFRSLLRRDYWKMGLFMFLAIMFHPIMALGPNIIAGAILITRRCRRSFLWRISSLAVTALLLSIAVITYKIGLMPRNFIMDAKWLEIVAFRSWFLSPLQWTSLEWEAIAASILLTCLSIKLLEDADIKHLALTTLLVTIAGIAATIFFTYFFPIAIFLQAQPWRIFWILRLLTPALSLLLVSKLWKCQGPCQLALPFILWPTILGGGVTDDALYWLIIAGIIISLPPQFASQLNLKMIRLLLLIESIVILSPHIVMTLVNVITFPQWAEVNDNKLDLATYALNPTLRLLILILLVWWLVRRTCMAERVVEAVLVLGLLFLVQPNLTQQTAQTMSQKKSNKLVVSSIEVTQKWRPLVPSGSVVLSDGLITPEMIWFDWQSCCYISRLQGAGVIFNRALAIEWDKRKEKVQRALSRKNQNDLSVWCQKEKIDFIVSRFELPLPKLATEQGIKLYATNINITKNPVTQY